MPPEAMASRVVTTMARASASSGRWAWARRRSSRVSGWGNLGAGPKPPQWGSKRRARASRARVRRARAVGEGGVGGRDGQVGHAAEGVGEPGRLLAHLGALVPPALVDRPQDLLEGGHAVAGLVGVVGAAVEGTAVGGEEDGHGPAAGAGHGLHRLHVDGVDVGPLLPVDLDVDEQLVHEGGRGLVLERLVGHHVAPVAGGVADGEQDRLVLGAGPLEGLVAPRVPVDGVVLVLLEVGARLVRQSVHNDLAFMGPTLQTERVQTALDVLLVVALGGMLWSAVVRIRRGAVVVPRCPSCERAVTRANPRCPHCDALLS